MRKGGEEGKRVGIHVCVRLSNTNIFNPPFQSFPLIPCLPLHVGGLNHQ